MSLSRTLLFIASAAAASGLAIAAFASHSETAEPAMDRAALIKRGEYLVYHVGLCTDCHSPRGQDGQFLPGRHLTGAPVVFTPNFPMPWAPAAPAIAGMPAGYSEEQLTHFLMTGERPNNLPPVRPPMPPYRLAKADAEAVAAYLHSFVPAAPTVAATETKP